ncbi:hypothetical protein AGOR_G00106250 [Albula goreensis]|uniref:Coiled-coil domain-containing protein 9B n=1 Tax=Albula goreensis TaxID=1534307 RepID=A0A8T3DMF9_9TELE|nr:hypothetical protein AGOR_G00106250 [Albula goreensis]
MIADSMQLPAPLPAASRLEGAQLSPMTSKMHRPNRESEPDAVLQSSCRVLACAASVSLCSLVDGVDAGRQISGLGREVSASHCSSGLSRLSPSPGAVGQTSEPLCARVSRCGFWTCQPLRGSRREWNDSGLPQMSCSEKKDQKDAELDKKIEALRKKNEALMKRYQEVEEDKKRAEEEGMALQSRKGKAEDLTITINKSTHETRVVTKKPGSGDSANRVQEPQQSDVSPFGMGRGKRRQLLVTMAGNTKGKRIVSEKRGQNHPASPGGMKDLTEEEEDFEQGGRGRHPQPSKSDSKSQEDEGKQELQGLTEDTLWLAECDPYYYQDAEGPALQSHTDLTIPTSKEEQLEYLRWKKEREQIDRERVARHKNAKGQWRRAWDMDKSENMFRERFHGESERGNKARGRNARRGHPRPAAESRGQQQRNRDKSGKNLPAVSSKAKGKDRLTGRARRWDAKEEGEHSQTMEASFEEFLEELDAFGGAEVDLSPTAGVENKEEDAMKDASLCSGPGSGDESVEAGDPEGGGGEPPDTDRHHVNKDAPLEVASGTPTSSPSDSVQKTRRPTEKKVRFSEETLEATKQTDENPSSPVPSESEKADAVKENGHGSSATSVATKEAALTPVLGLEGPEDQDSQEQDQGVPNPPQSSDPLSGLPEECPSEGQGPEDTAKTEMPENEHNNAQGLTPETDHRPLDGNSAALSEQSADQPLKHSKNTRSPEEMIDSSLCVLSLDSGDPHTYHKTSNDKVKENGKVV